MNIRPGDLVMVVRTTPCCNRATGVEGSVFRVTNVTDRFTRCLWCDFRHAQLGAEGHRQTGSIRFDRLIKIDPPPVRIERDEEIAL